MVLIAIFSANSVAFAQGTGNANTTTGGTQQIQGSATTIPARDAQVEGYMSGARKSDVDGQSEVAFNLIGCSAGQLLSNIIQAGFNSLFGSLTGQLKNQVVRLVPVDTQYTELEKDTKLQTSANTIQSVYGVPFGSSWDAMAWCIVNSIITDIANKTIAWANRGFQGKPAFLQNPDRFFQGLADREAATFLQNLAYDTTGLNICQPFRIQLAIGVSEAYGNAYNNINRGGAINGIGAYGAYGRRASCTMNRITQNLQNFGTNNVSFTTTNGLPIKGVTGYWSAFNASRRSPNNVWGSYMLANDYLYAQIRSQQNTARFELGLNKGWLNFKKCEDEKDPNSCDTYTPGSLIQSSLEKSLGLGKDRLVAVQKFDQVITAVVNSLIRVALNKVLESVQK